MKNPGLYNSMPIRRALNSPELSIEAVAKKSGLSIGAVTKVRDGRNVMVSTLIAVCRGLRVGPEELFEFEERATAAPRQK